MFMEHLTAAFKNYYSIKGSHKEFCQTTFENQAEAIAAEGNLQKEKVLKNLPSNTTTIIMPLT